MTHPEDPTRPAGAAACSCGAWWTSTTRSHCAADGCHRTFSGETAADRHRQGRFGIDRHCVDPATVGLVPVEKPYGVLWQNPAPEGGSLAPWAAAQTA